MVKERQRLFMVKSFADSRMLEVNMVADFWFVKILYAEE